MKKVVLCLLVAVAVTGVACAGTVTYACGHKKEVKGRPSQQVSGICPTCAEAKSGARQQASQDFGNGSAPNTYGACNGYTNYEEYDQCESSYLKTYSDHKSAAEGNYQ